MNSFCNSLVFSKHFLPFTCFRHLLTDLFLTSSAFSTRYINFHNFFTQHSFLCVVKFFLFFQDYNYFEGITITIKSSKTILILFSPIIIPKDFLTYPILAHSPSSVEDLLTGCLFYTVWNHFYSTSILSYSSNHFSGSLFTSYHFCISDPRESSPIEILTPHLLLEDWPDSHIPIFIPIDRSNFDCLNTQVGSVALIPKSSLSKVTFAVAA